MNKILELGDVLPTATSYFCSYKLCRKPIERPKYVLAKNSIVVQGEDRTYPEKTSPYCSTDCIAAGVAEIVIAATRW